MKKATLLFILLAFSSFEMKAQLMVAFTAEGGYAGSTVKTAQLPLFLETYNNYNSAGMTKAFGMKTGMASGKYMAFGMGIGGEKCKCIVTFGKYLTTTPHLEARFAAGDGRDVWMELKDASTSTDVRFDVGRFTTGFEFDMLIRTVSIYSEYVFPDGSTSFGSEHVLNGVYTSNRLQVGTGAHIGFKIIKGVYLIGKAEYIFETDKKHPEYHQYEDLNSFRGMSQDYLPFNMTEYYDNPSNSTGNSIFNDVHGLRFNFGIQIMLSNNVD